MGKTVVAILAVAAIIAVQFIPGVNAAVDSAIAAVGLTGTITASAVISTFTALALGVVSMALTPTPKFNAPETSASPIKSPIPPRVSAYGTSRLYGAYVLFKNTDYSVNSDTFAPYALDVLAMHDGRIDAIVQRYLGDDKITISTGGFATPAGYVNALPNKAYGNLTVRWYETLGETPGTANWPEFISKLPHDWDSHHRGDGVAMLGIVWRPVSSDEFGERFPQGAAAASIVARWQHVYDPRDGTQDVSDPDTWKWSENAVLHLLHYRLVREKARRELGAALPTADALQDAWDLFFAPTVAYWIEAANVADEAVPLNAGGTEARYRSLLAHKHTDAHKDVITGLTSCFDGWTSPRADGALVVFAGKYYAPTVSIGPDQIVSYSWQYGVVDEEAINELKITYVSAPHDYNPVDADSWQDQDDILARGAVRTQGVDFLVPSHGQARRLAKRLIARIMASNRGVITTNVAGRIVRGQRYIRLTIREAGATFFDGVAEITGLTRNLATGGVTFSWVEIDANIDAWNPATEEGAPAPVKETITLLAPPAPVITSASLVYDNSATGSTGVRVQIDLDGPSGDDLTWFARWRRVGAAVWNEQRYTDIDSSAGVELLTGFVPADRDLEVEVAYMSGTGALSAYSFPSTEVSTDTSTVAPDDALSITLVEWSDRLVMTTDPLPRAKSYRWRFYASDGTTLKRTLTTTIPEVVYSKAQAHLDGALRDYKVEVAGANAAGFGGAFMSSLLSKPAPAAVTGVAFADGTSTSTATFTELTGVDDLAGYTIAFSTTTGFDPMTAGSAINAAGSPAYTPQLPAGSYFGKVAAYDSWSSRPDLLNFSSQDAFTITTGTGGAAAGGGGGGGFQGGGGFGAGGSVNEV